MATGAAAGTRWVKVQGVAVDVYNHVAGSVLNGGVRVGIGVAEEPNGCITGFFGVLRLLGRKGAKGDKHGGINGDGVIKECADYLLQKVDGLWGQQGGVVGVVSVLDFGAIGGGFPGIEGILRVRRLRVLELV